MFIYLSLIFNFLQNEGEYLWCFKRESKKRKTNFNRGTKQLVYFSQEHGESEEKCKEILLRDLVGLFQEQFFVARKGCIKGCSKIFIFPAKKLRKIRVLIIRMRRFFFFYSVSNICSIMANFPAKRLGKNTVLKNTHAPFFF